MADDRPGNELVKVAFARDRMEGEMIHGLLENAGIPSLLEQEGLGVDGPRLGAMVHASRAEEARALLSETLVEDGEAAMPEVGNAEYLEEANGGRARNYGVVGAYGRALAWSVGAMGVAFGAFLLLRGF